MFANIAELQLKGIDLKTLEYPQQDFSYSVACPGWINDNVFSAVLKHIEEEARQIGVNVKAFDTKFAELFDAILNGRLSHLRSALNLKDF